MGEERSTGQLTLYVGINRECFGIDGLSLDFGESCCRLFRSGFQPSRRSWVYYFLLLFCIYFLFIM